jgi:membrane protein
LIDVLALDVTAMKFRKLVSLLKKSAKDWIDDDAPRQSAALAFYTILSLSPLVILGLKIASIFINRSAVQSHLLSEVQGMAGIDARNEVQALLASARKIPGGITATTLGFITLLFGASGVFGELRSALNNIWDAPLRSESSVWRLVRERLFSFAMVLSVGFILLVSLVASAVLDAISKFFTRLLPLPDGALVAFNFAASFCGIAILFALIFRYLPETRVEWKDVRLGAVMTAIFFTIGKTLLSLYLGRMTPGSAYGAAGSLVAVVIWVYYSAQVFMLGAEFTHVHMLTGRDTPAIDGRSSPKSSAA